jgi:hypothetical protein
MFDEYTLRGIAGWRCMEVNVQSSTTAIANLLRGYRGLTVVELSDELMLPVGSNEGG